MLPTPCVLHTILSPCIRLTKTRCLPPNRKLSPLLSAEKCLVCFAVFMSFYHLSAACKTSQVQRVLCILRYPSYDLHVDVRTWVLCLMSVLSPRSSCLVLDRGTALCACL